MLGSFDPMWLFFSLFPGAAGMVLLTYGRKRGRWPHAVAGVLFLVYPYFTGSVAALLVVGVAIAVGLWWATGRGY